MDKGNCHKCGKKIQRTLHEQCMYCGAELSESQKFTNKEKEELLEKKVTRERKMSELEKKKNKRKKSSNGLSGSSGGTNWYSDFGGSDSGGCD